MYMCIYIYIYMYIYIHIYIYIYMYIYSTAPSRHTTAKSLLDSPQTTILSGSTQAQVCCSV